MSRPTVFISHSAKCERARSVCAAVKACLFEAGFTPFLCYDSLRGDPEWEKKLDQALDGSVGAVLVLSDSALESNWVPIEADRLRAIARSDPMFRIAVIYVPPAEPENFGAKSRFAPVRITEIQPLPLCPAGVTLPPKTEPLPPSILLDLQQTILSHFTALITHHSGKGDALPALENVVSDALRFHDGDAIRDALDFMRPGLTSSSLQPATRRRLLAQAMFDRANFDRIPEALEKLRLKPCEAERVYDILSANWVSPGSGRSIASIARGERGARILRLPPSKRFLLQGTLKRGASRIPDNRKPYVKIIELGGNVVGGHGEDKVRAFLTGAVLGQSSAGNGSELGLEEELELIENRCRSPVFVIVPVQEFSEDLERIIRGHLPTATIVVEADPAQLMVAPHDRIRQLPYPLSPESVEAMKKAPITIRDLKFQLID